MSEVSLADLSFPVYLVGQRPPVVEEGVTFYLGAKPIVDGPDEYYYAIIDDKNVPGKSLAARRLALLGMNRPLHKLRKSCYFLSDMLKLASAAQWFIDSRGLLFRYKKSRFVPLIFKKVLEVIPIDSGGATIRVQGMSTRYKTLYAPRDYEKYAGLLEINPKQYTLYGLYDQLYDNSRRMV